jgi:threonine dehydrogenase-like Zn-dependent dehydrogenase
MAATGTMKAAILAEPGHFRLEERQKPQPGPNQVLLELEGCGVCASNIPPFQGREWFEYPFGPGQPGHEGWGVVEAVGAQVTDLRPGDRVAALTYNAYATHDIADADACVKLPEQLDGVPIPGEPLGCAMNIFERADIREGQTVAVVGVGFLGSLLCGLAAGKGARVIAISRREVARRFGERFGASETIPMVDHGEILERVADLTEGGMCDRAIECVGKQWPLDLAAELTRVRGRLVIAGYHQDGARQVNMQMWNWRGLDVVNAHERDPNVYVQGIRSAVEALEDGRLDPAPLYTHQFGLDEMEDALRAAVERPGGFMKALIMNRRTTREKSGAREVGRG